MNHVEEQTLDESMDDVTDDSKPLMTPSELERRKQRHELSRLFSEVNWAAKCLKIVREIELICSELHEGFFVFAHRALVDDALSCLMRVLDRNNQTFSFWKLDSRFPQRIKTICEREKIDLARIREFDGRLRKARNNTHFHINKEYAADAEALWSQLLITHSEMTNVALDLAKIISSIFCEEYRFPANLSRYDAADVRPILEQLHKCKLGNFVKR